MFEIILFFVGVFGFPQLEMAPADFSLQSCGDLAATEQAAFMEAVRADQCIGDACVCAPINWNGSCYLMTNNCSRLVEFRVKAGPGLNTTVVRPGEQVALRFLGGPCYTALGLPYYATYK